MSDESWHWVEYYDVTAERPAWQTVSKAIELFAAEDEAAGRAPDPPRLAVDLGCGAGRDVRQLLRAGWRVIAVDSEPEAGMALEKHVEPESRSRLEIVIADIAEYPIPPCDLVNASVSLQFLGADSYAATWKRIVEALHPGGRFSAMIYGDRDESASDPDYTMVPRYRIQSDLWGFEIETWVEREEDTKLALGDPHHLHMIEFVARRLS